MIRHGGHLEDALGVILEDILENFLEDSSGEQPIEATWEGNAPLVNNFSYHAK
jgi:hypothetical protein